MIDMIAAGRGGFSTACYWRDALSTAFCAFDVAVVVTADKQVLTWFRFVTWRDRCWSGVPDCDGDFAGDYPLCRQRDHFTWVIPHRAVGITDADAVLLLVAALTATATMFDGPLVLLV